PRAGAAPRAGAEPADDRTAEIALPRPRRRQPSSDSTMILPTQKVSIVKDEDEPVREQPKIAAVYRSGGRRAADAGGHGEPRRAGGHPPDRRSVARDEAAAGRPAQEAGRRRHGPDRLR